MKAGSVGSPNPDPNANISAAISEGKDETARRGSDARVEVLVRKAQQGDKSALGEIYELFFPAISRLTRFYLGSAGEDATAETFLRAWVSLPRYRPERGPLVGWLYGIARHVVADELTRRTRIEPVEDVPDMGIELSRDDAVVLAAAIKKLPADQRTIIEMKYFLGMKNPEVAAALNKSIAAINAQRWRALQSLKKWVER